jgi:organic radical activating enzyme
MKWNTLLPFEKIIDGFNMLKVFPRSIISLIGGEPTLYPKFDRVLERLSELNHEGHIYTNGTTKFFNNVDLLLASKFTWTFSYHLNETDDVLFFTNIEKFVKNDIRVELTVPAQNMTPELLALIKKLKINTVITFIHDVQNGDNKNPDIANWVYDIKLPHLKNMSRFNNIPVYFKGYECDYNEINVVNNYMRSNDCNHSIDMEMNSENLNIIKHYKKTICDRDTCKLDCAFLLPEKRKCV